MSFQRRAIAGACAMFLVSACGGGDDRDTAATNQRGDARYVTVDTNVGVRVVRGFLDVWEPLTRLVDAGAPAQANGSFPAVVARTTA
ncbi:hypothetical protein FOB72_23555 [Cupriavidus pauculus]|uniref:Uncharacterized protein n=1 Tax=Cupriavidus pauculus TaxID=82633 RepID=A0A5P2H9Z7_9BURK|nr:hypothetical protein FOB72_23555 [Cupriavidus pauculus]